MADSTWREKLAWAAGFFDGEGSVPNSTRKRTEFSVQISQVERAPLERFAMITGVGRIKGPFGPYAHAPRKSPWWKYCVYSHEEVQYLAALLWPWLGPTKRAAFRRVLVAAHNSFTKAGYSRRYEEQKAYRERRKARSAVT